MHLKRIFIVVFVLVVMFSFSYKVITYSRAEISIPSEIKITDDDGSALIGLVYSGLETKNGDTQKAKFTIINNMDKNVAVVIDICGKEFNTFNNIHPGGEEDFSILITDESGELDIELKAEWTGGSAVIEKTIELED